MRFASRRGIGDPARGFGLIGAAELPYVVGARPAIRPHVAAAVALEASYLQDAGKHLGTIAWNSGIIHLRVI